MKKEGKEGEERRNVKGREVKREGGKKGRGRRCIM